jgi:DNA-binding CsgD family transcriptional regulator
VARLVAQNLTCAVIGERLGKSRRTIERHRGNVMRQLRVATPAELRALLESIRVLR